MKSINLKKKIMEALSKKQRLIVREVWNLKPYQRISENITDWIERNIYSL